MPRGLALAQTLAQTLHETLAQTLAQTLTQTLAQTLASYITFHYITLHYIKIHCGTEYTGNIQERKQLFEMKNRMTPIPQS